MTPEEENLGHRSHKEWLEGHNPDVVDEIYAADCVIYSNHILAPSDLVARGSKPTAPACILPFLI